MLTSQRDLFPAVRDLLRRVVGRSPVVIAYVVVPVFVLFLGAGSADPTAVFGQLDDPVILMRFQAAEDGNGKIMDRHGLLVLLDTNTEACTIPIARPASTEMLTTMPSPTLLANKSILSLEPGVLRVAGRLLGNERAGIFLPGAQPHGVVSFPGREIPWDELTLPSQRSRGLVTWLLIASLGILVSLLVDQSKGAPADS